MDKRLKLFAISLTSIISATTLGVVAFNYSNNIAFATRAVDAKTTTITLDSSEKPVIGNDGNGTLAYSKNNFASFSYTGASVFENGHVTLADGGTIYKNEASNKLKSFTANFTGGSLKLQTGYSVGDVCYEYTLENGIDTLVKGNYFILKSEGATNISNISICFECEDEEIEGDHDYESGWTTNETHHWHRSLEDNCVRKGNYAEHTQFDIDMVAPTKETTGSYNGKECSVCERTLVTPTVLPILSETDYDISYRTAMIDGEVRDSETYTLKTDSSVSFDIGYNDTVYTEYIHAGSSYYSLNRWNELFPAAQATAVDGVLTITLDGDTTVTAESGGALDGQLDLMLYDSVVIKGNGSLTVAYAQEIDGIEAWNLTIEKGATVNLIGANEAKKTGFKVYGTLQINDTANVSKYGHAVGFNTDKDGSSSNTFALNIGSTGKLIIDQAGNGISVWNTPSGGASINVNGELTMTNIRNKGIYLESPVNVNFNNGCNVDLKITGTSTNATAISELSHVAIETTRNNNGSKDDTPAAAINFNGGKVDITSGDIGIKANEKMNHYFSNNAVVNITADKVGIYACSNSSDDNNLMKMSGNSSLTITSTNGSGIYCNNGGCFKIEGSSTLNITANSGGIYGFRMLRVYEGSWRTPTKVNASLIVKSAGASDTTGGKTPDGNPIQGRGNASTDIGFSTNGQVLIEKTGTQSKTGLHLGNVKSGGGNFIIVDCGNFTIKNCSNAIGCWVASGATVTYTHSSDQYRINVVDCNKIVNGTTLSGLSAYTSSGAVNVIKTNV